MTRILILLAGLLVVGESFALPPCPTYPYFDNCFGARSIRGGKYVGEWKDNKMHGSGTFTWGSMQYVGEFKDNKMIGRGILTRLKGNMEGMRHVGLFHDTFYEGITYSASGEVLATQSNSRGCSGCTPTARQLAIVREVESIQVATTPTPVPQPSTPSDRRLVSTGTGFIVNQDFVVTADHVLRMNKQGDQCNKISILYRKDEYQAKVVDNDPANDLGLVKLSKPISSTAKLRDDPDLRLGEIAVNYGFPLTGELSSSAKVTGGAVNSLAGFNNNSAVLQYDAASQHGNSGGPVLDSSGNVIGVVRSKLDDAETQLVNFATKSTILEGFLRANKVPFEKADLGEKLELPDIAEKAERFTVLVGCWE